MKVALIALLLLAVMCFVVLTRRRAAVREAEEAAQARSRTMNARNRARVPTVSNNLKGVTASQTIDPVRPGSRDDEYVDDR
jgi:hypothetical protein